MDDIIYLTPSLRELTYINLYIIIPVVDLNIDTMLMNIYMNTRDKLMLQYFFNLFQLVYHVVSLVLGSIETPNR